MILDTNALSAFADGDERLLRVIEDQTDLAVPVIALGEYLFGIHQSRFRLRYEKWLSAHLRLFGVLAAGRDTAKILCRDPTRVKRGRSTDPQQ